MARKKASRATRANTLIRQNDLVLAAIIAAVVIIVGVGLGWENNKVVPVNPAATAHYRQEKTNKLTFMVNWDGPIYLNIAENGYAHKNQANFFPLYPLVVRVVHYVVRSWVYSTLAVSWACFVGATLFYIKIIKRLYSPAGTHEALRAAIFFVLFPTGIFLLSAYTESLFALLALGAIYFALQKCYIPAAFMAALSSATHVNGVFVAALVGMILLEEGARFLKATAVAAAGVLGLVGYMIYQLDRFHSPLAFLHAQQKHSWLNFGPVHLIGELATLNGLFMLLIIASAVYWWPKRRSFSIYSLFYVLILFVGGKNFSGVGRYALMVFPLQFMAYEYLRDKQLRYTAAVIVTSVLWTFFALRYMGGYSGG